MIPLYNSKQIREADSYAINKLGIPGIILMENAALNIYNKILDEYKNIENITSVGIICGKGNNGGDGFAVARHFITNGYSVKIISIAKETELKNDALINFRITKNLVKSNKSCSLHFYKNIKELNEIKNCDIIIDAMLGTGSKGELQEPYYSIIDIVNNFDSIKIAIDIPTGLDVDKGYGGKIFNSDLTITLAENKKGLFFNDGYSNSGKVVKESIGIDERFFDKFSIDEYLIEPEDVFLGLPLKTTDLHKYSSGKVLTIAGSGHLPGAAILASKSVFKSGGGASILAFPNSIKNIALSKLDEVVVHSYNDSGTEFLSANNIKELHDKIIWADVIAVGPGLGKEGNTFNAVSELLCKYPNKKFVIDADAVVAIGKNKYKKLDLSNKVLTPHHKEFADLIGLEFSELKKDLLKFGKKFALENNCYLVLKGAPTIIFNPNGESFINTAGNPGMAKFGSGDVLTGVLAGFLSQSNNLEKSCITAVYLHSLAADLLVKEKTEYGYVASDIMENIPNAIKFIINSFI